MSYRRFSTAVLVFTAVLGIWWFASYSGKVNPFLLPSPQKVFATLIDLASSQALTKHTAISLQRVGIGYGLAVAIAVPLAIAFSLSTVLRNLCEPLLEFLRQIPPLALMPLFMLWLGIGEMQKIGIIILACFFPIFLGARGGIAQVDRKLIEVGQVSGLRWPEIMWRIVLPSSLPALVIGLRIGLGYSWRALVGAELIASSAGLGYMIIDAQDLARTDIVLVGILVIGLIGLIADFTLKRILGYAAPWLSADLKVARA